MFAATQAIHDLLLDLAPEGASHDTAACGFCSPSDTEDTMDTFSPEQVEARVNEATAALQAQLRELQEQLGQTETAAAVEAAVADAVAPLQTRVDELTAQLDASVAEARTATEKYDALVALLEEAEAARVAREEAEARKDERIAAAREAAPFFNDEDVAQRADRWCALDDDAFEAQLVDYRELAARVGTDAGNGAGNGAGSQLPPNSTAMTAADQGDSQGRKGSAVKEALALRGTRLDPNSLG